MFLELSFIAAFLGGLLTLLPSCGPFILPAFFALAFKEKDRLVLMTLVLFAGFLATFIPLGLGITALIHLVFTNTKFVHVASGVVLITLGVMSLFGVSMPGPRIPALARSRMTPKSHDVLSIFIFGAIFGLATGSCTAPTIGAVLTVVVAQGVGLQSILLLMAYALGMILPLILLAVFFDRIPEKRKDWFFRKVFTIKLLGKKFKTPLSNMIAAVIFILMGVVFLFSDIRNALAGIFDSIGLTDAVIGLYDQGLEVSKNITSTGQLLFFVLVILSIITALVWTKKRR